jgi:hypothetical protein
VILQVDDPFTEAEAEHQGDTKSAVMMQNPDVSLQRLRGY